MTRVRVTTPYGLVAAAGTTVLATKRELVGITRRVERELAAGPPDEVSATLQDERFLTPRTRAVYVDLAARGSLVRLHARGLQAWLGPGVAGISLDDDDPLVDEWSLVALGPRPVVVAATDLGREVGADDDRAFRYAVSRDRGLVEACARALRG